jgi:cytochrome c oxidase cbb3-type subunit 2
VGVPYTDEMIENAEAGPDGAGRSRMRIRPGSRSAIPKAKLGDFDGNPAVVTEMDALVAYLQMLGTLVDFST